MLHIFTEEETRKGGKIRGTSHFEDGTGLFAQTPEQWEAVCKRGGEVQGAANVKNGTGLFGQTPEQWAAVRKKAGHVQGLANVANGNLEYARHCRLHVLRERKKGGNWCRFCDEAIAYA
jgi:hypothetical protein